MRWPGWHQRVRKNLSPYLDGELPAAEQRRLEAHLAACEACRSDLAELRAVAKALASIPPEKEPRSFALTPSMAEGPGRPAPSALRRLEMASRLVAAGLAVALAAVLLVDLRGGQEAAQGPAAYPSTAMDREVQGMPGLAPAASGGAEEGAPQPSLPAAEAPGLQGEAGQTPPAPLGSPSALQAAPAGGEPEASAGVMSKSLVGEQAGGGNGLGAVEAGLAAGLGLAVAASGALAIARRRNH